LSQRGFGDGLWFPARKMLLGGASPRLAILSSDKIGDPVFSRNKSLGEGCVTRFILRLFLLYSKTTARIILVFRNFR
jgi:hypothetical protein